jgi:hypothetical protein
VLADAHFIFRENIVRKLFLENYKEFILEYGMFKGVF